MYYICHSYFEILIGSCFVMVSSVLDKAGKLTEHGKDFSKPNIMNSN